MELIQQLKLRQGFASGSLSRIAAKACGKVLPSASVIVASGLFMEIRSSQSAPGKGIETVSKPSEDSAAIPVSFFSKNPAQHTVKTANDTKIANSVAC